MPGVMLDHDVVAVSFLFIWVAAWLLATWGVRVAQRFGVRLPRHFHRPMTIRGKTWPRVAVILPLKGVDGDTAANVESLLKQDYPEYRLIFAVESGEDPVVGLLKGYAEGDSRVEIVVAGAADCRGQKVHNQLAAVARTTERDDVLAFMDADARPNPGWLRALVAPLTRDRIGATTGYRYYYPVKPHPANKIVMLLNAQVAATFGPYRRTMAWGGSMAIRRADFFGFGVHEHWQHALSDDYVLTWCVKHKAGTQLHFVPQCIVGSEAVFNWGKLFEFAARQYRITRICAPVVWVTALLGTLVYLAALGYSLVMSVDGFFDPDQTVLGMEHIQHLLMFAGLYAMSALRGLMLVWAGEFLLPEHRAAVRSALPWAILGMPVCYLVSLLVILRSAFGRIVVWRGIAYRMISRTQTEVLRGGDAVAVPSGEAQERSPLGGVG
jgi:ceramide glucosyltransferase